ncbi:hypothetical protein LF1_51170 [Rubripirellula obstinata]|uniref:Squalene cyclase C-terminal domain-containing protein n=1 Tax=Rubripirellula obstinata TaxID=406547 RepID=A0A5B1CQM8_9BACT|nr:prenyltransferase/squalene oxidase repeat-containing protein [Rubripirellula obstinata]KAA1262551.1 hypothetical protein LF1_51170 [Rubripirellula obstinata]
MATDAPSTKDKPRSTAAPTLDGEIEPLARDDEIDGHRQGGLLGLVRAVPAWMISMLVHVAILLLLGLITIADPVKVVNVLTASSTEDDGPEIEEFAIEEIDPGEMSETEEMSEPMPEISESIETLEPLEVAPMEMAEFAMEMPDMAGTLASQPSELQTLTQMMMQPLDSRSADSKKRLLRAYGGNSSSEAAVTNALKWLSRHQLPNGGWTYQHNLVCNGACGDPGEPKQAKRVNSATAMALLPFMGAGQTHVKGDYRSVVYRGLKFLIQNGKAGNLNGLPVLDFTGGNSNMYDQGLATIALCEAYAMTEDPELLYPAQAAVNFVAAAQCSDGGWYYQPRQRDGGDTSVTGWQVMALKSAHMGHLLVPPKSVQGSILFLDKVGSKEGDIYGYRSRIKKATNRPGCVAVGLLCRMYTGWDKTHPGIVKGVGHLSKIGVDKRDIYYNYYAAQVLRHYGGKDWDKFNVELRDWLVETQAQGRGDKGSWFFPKSKSHRGPLEGGRLASTAFATMILEVYYRHMPLYAKGAAEEDFPL